MPHVFISYKREDQDFALTLKQHVQTAGIDVWMDTERLQAGEDWRQAIDEAIIKDAFALVVVMTPEAKASEYVTYEWSCAHGAGLPIIPIMLKTTPLHPRLAVLQFLDFRQASRWDLLITRLQQLEQAQEVGQISVPRTAPSAVRQAVMALDNHDRIVRQSALNSLEQMQHPTARTVLAAAMLHPTRDVQVGAADALLRLRDANTIPAMLAVLHRVDRDLQNKIAQILTAIGAPCAQPLAATLRDPDQDIRLLAVQVISRLDSFAIVPIIDDLIASLSDPSARVRRLAAVSLRQIIDPKAVIALIKTLRDEDIQVRDQAIMSLVEIGDPAVEKLTRVLEHSDWRREHEMIMNMLGMIGSPKALPALLVQLNSNDIKRQVAALEALYQLIARGGKHISKSDNHDLQRRLTPLLYDKDQQLRRNAARILRSIHWHPQAPADAAMAALLWHDDLTCAEAGAAALPTIIAALDDPVHQVRITAVRALGRLCPPDALPSLAALLPEADGKMRDEIVSSLGKYPQGVLPHLLSRLGSMGGDFQQDWRFTRELQDLITNSATAADLPLILSTLAEFPKDNWAERMLQDLVRQLVDQMPIEAAIDLFVLNFEQHESAAFRSFLLDMLRKLNAISAMPTLLNALRDPDYQINSSAAMALAQIHFKDSVQQTRCEAELVLMLGSAELEVRASVIWLIGERRIRDGIPALIAQLEDRSATMVEGMRMCDLAARALSRMPSPEALSAVQQWRQTQGQPS